MVVGNQGSSAKVSSESMPSWAGSRFEMRAIRVRGKVLAPDQLPFLDDDTLL